MNSLNRATISESDRAAKYLTVVIDGDAYGIAVRKVREIIRLQEITSVPRMPDYVNGVINLRGRVVPIIDLRARFGLQVEFTPRTCIVIVQVELNAGCNVPFGLIVNSVEEVISIAPEAIEPTPEFGIRVNSSCLVGIAKVGGQVKMLLDIDRVIMPETVRLIVEHASGEGAGVTCSIDQKPRA